MLTSTDFVEDSDRQYILNLALTEGSRPLSVFRDKCSEEMASPGIFLGQGWRENDKSENIVRSDRRATMCVENIFFKTKKLQMKILLGKSQMALRKCKSNTTTLNTGVLKQKGAVERLIHLD